MRRLILLRHAKSSWADPGQRDFDRPLNPRGQRAAAAVGAWLIGQDLLPDAALVSPAARTRETWAQLGPAFAAVPVRFLQDLYHAEAPALLAHLQAAPAEAATVLILGHQPGIGELATRLLPEPPDDPEYLRYPTAGTAVIDFDVADWTEAHWGEGRLFAFTTPRRLE